MASFIAILEDNPSRVALMRKCLAEIFPEFSSVIFDKSGEMIDWLREHLSDASLISLDHDLPVTMIDGQSVDYGTGREVADFLATCSPTCPIIIHSSNDPAARGMARVLSEAGWPCSRVFPRDANDWIGTDWAGVLKSLKSGGWISG